MENEPMTHFPAISRLVCVAAIIGSAFFGVARASTITALNLVEVTPKIITSGQPSVEALETLGKQKIEAVIFLVPSHVPGVIANEAAILAKQGIAYMHIPIPFGAPTEQHYLAFAEAMAKLADKKVLVHCEINLRASSMVFLYRVIALKEDPSVVYDSVAKVWSPRGAWKPFIDNLLNKQNIKFTTY